MRDTDYAFCVARIRANEAKLLSDSFINRLVEADNYNSAVSLLRESGWIDTDSDSYGFIRHQSKSLWTLFYESVPDKSVLDGLCVLNDYFNIKTAIKCILSGEKAEKYYAEPTSLDLERLSVSIDERKFDVFRDEHMLKTANEAYEVACATNNGQSAEIIVDVAALGKLREFSSGSRYSTFSKICSFIVDTSNIKTAIRCAALGKSPGFIKSALSSCCKINKDRLVEYASADIGALRSYLSTSEYSEGVELYFTNPALFDKWCDGRVIEIATQSSFTSFGFDPVCAYFYKKTNEIKTVKLILSAKQAGMPVDLLRERVRLNYA